MTKRLTTRSRATAEAIAGAVEFTTSGSLRGEENRHPYVYSGHLDRLHSELLRSDALDGIDYIVWSYSTPIAWRRTDGRWRIVAQSFSPTTSKHQGNLYLIEREEHHVYLSPVKGVKDVRHRVECDTCGTVLRLFSHIGPAREFAHGHRFNADHPLFGAQVVSV